MWIFSKTGFVSITDNPAIKGTYTVRARTREDLEDFIKTDMALSDIEGNGWLKKTLATIKDAGDARDYRWRIVMSKQTVKAIIADQLEDIDYTNVKDNIDKGDPKRHNALLGVWSSMMEMQEGGLYHNRQLGSGMTDEEWYERYDGWVT